MTYLICIQVHYIIYIYIYIQFYRLYKLVQVGESRWIFGILHFQHDVVLKCICKFSMFKYYNKIHQNFNGKVGLNSIWQLISRHTCYLLFIMPKFFKFCNHLIINSKKKHHVFIILFSIIFNLHSLTCVKNWTIFQLFWKLLLFFCIFYHVFT
jgi:hypothetical protein